MDEVEGKPGKEDRHFFYAMFILFIILATGILLAGYFYYRNHEKHHRAAMENQLSAIADLKVRELVQWRRERLGDAAVYFKNDNFSGLVKRFFENPEDPDAGKRLDTWLNKVRAAYHYDRVFLLNAQGTVRMSAPESPEPVAPHLPRHVSEVLSSGEAAFLDFHRDSPDGPVFLAVLCPILEQQGGSLPLGVLVLRVNPETYLYPMIQSWPVESKTAETLLVRREEGNVLFLNALRFRKDAAISLKFSLDRGDDLPAVMAVLGKEGVVEGRDYRGVQVIASVRSVPDSPWFLVARMDRTEIFAPLRERLWTIVVLVGSLLIGIALGTGLIWRQRQARFYRERYKAAEALRASEARYRETLDSMLEGCQIVGFDWCYLYVNDAAARHGRRIKDELVGHTMMEVYPGIETTEMFAVLKRCMDERVSGRMENEFKYTDGAAAWFELSIQPVPEGIFILSMDHTERKRAEECERHLNAVLRSIRNVNQLIVRENQRGRLIRRACENLVASRGFQGSWIILTDRSSTDCETACAGFKNSLFNEMVSRFQADKLPVCCRHDWKENDVTVIVNPAVTCKDCPLAKVYHGNAAMTGELRYQDKAYGWLGVSVPPEFADDPEERSLLSEIAGDIAFALYGMDMEAERNRSEQTLRAIFDSAADGILLADAESGRFVKGNNAICGMLGYTAEEIKGLSVADIHPLESLDQARSQFQKQVRGEIKLSRDIPVKRKDGSVFLADVNSSPFNLDGRIHLLGIFRDITDRKNLEEQLFQFQKLESVGRLTGGISHDFNNLLTTMIGNAQLVLTDIPGDDPMREELEEIKAAGERAASLTRQLLAFSRKQVLQPEVMNLNDTVRGMEKMLLRMVREDIEIKTILPSDLGQVEADEGQIEQVIMNLVVNARDAMLKSGKITIETANADLGEEYARVHIAVTPGPYVMLSVSDTGTGMAKEVQAQIFEPFYTTKEKGKGTGLGLSTVYGIVKQSRGNIWVYSEPGRGTTFKVYLPRVDKPVLETDRKVKALDVPTGSETILVVEDDKQVRKFTARVLREYGYKLLEASNGEEAIEVAINHPEPIHLLLTDVVMPGMSSKDMEERLKSLRPDLRALYMSGYTDNTIVHHGVLDSGKAFLGKPFTPESLGRKVREVLKGTKDE